LRHKTERGRIVETGMRWNKQTQRKRLSPDPISSIFCEFAVQLTVRQIYHKSYDASPRQIGSYTNKIAQLSLESALRSIQFLLQYWPSRLSKVD